jgi:polysaccharide pyruvyl transferase WcaK-like protein
MIANLLLRIPGVEIVGITLSPEDTQSRHGIVTFPITETYRETYRLVGSRRFAVGHSKTPSKLRFVKEALKRIKWLQKAVRLARTVRQEGQHIVCAARLVRTLDRVIVAGGGALDEFWGGPWGHPWTLLKFAVLSRLFGVSYLFVSVGACMLDHRLSRGFVGGALSLAQYRSYRDHNSYTEMKAMHPRLSGTVSPDLAFGYCCPLLPSLRNRPFVAKQLLIAVSPIAFCDPRVWPLKDGVRYARYLQQMAGFLKWIIENGHELLLFATDGPDADTVNDLLGILSVESVDTSGIQVLPGPPEQTTEKLLQRLCHADFVIASRLHGIILSHLIAVPVVALSYDRKVDIYMKEIGQPAYCMSIDLFTSTTLTERFTALQAAGELESTHLERAVRLNREKVEAQYDFLFGDRASVSLTAQSADQRLMQAQS